jgi:hypothetical protein
MSPRVRTLAHSIESLIRYGVPDFKGKHTNHSTTYYFVPTTHYLPPSICYIILFPQHILLLILINYLPPERSPIL